MNKKVFKVSIVMLILGFVLLFSGIQTGGLDYLADVNIDSYSLFKSKKINKYTMDLDKISSVEVEFFNSNFEIRKSENGKNYVEYFSKNEEDYSIKLDDEKLFVQSLEKEEGFSLGIKLNLNVFKNFLINGKVSDNSFILYLSESELENLSFSNFSGKVDISDVNFRNIRLNLKSGTCKLKNLKTENIELLNSAGNIYLENVNNSNYFTSENKAGNIEFKNSKFHLCKVEQKAGNVNFSNVEISQFLKVENKAGNIKCSLVYDENVNYDLDLESKVGNISVDKDFKRNKAVTKLVKISLKSKAGNIKLERY